MFGYILRRIFLTVPVLLGAAFLVFAIVRLIPGDPATAIAGPQASDEFIALIAEEYHLNEPLHVQFGFFLADLARGNLGTSTFSRRPVAVELGERFPRTVQLTLAALVVAVSIGIPAGIVSARRKNSIFDNMSMFIALFGAAAPLFWLGLMLQLLFSVRLGWLPATGAGSPAHLVLPAFTLGMAAAGLIARITRSSMLEVLKMEYVQTARAKGLGERDVVYGHAFRNAMIPVVTVVGLQFGVLLGGSVLTESVFAWPGVGRLLVDSILTRDYPVVQGAVLVLAAASVVINLVIDLLYAVLDPRIGYHGEAA